MAGIPGPFGGTSGGGTDFDADDAFVPEHVPVPGTFLEGHDILAGREHAALHCLTRDCFEERGVYDMTFGYNLARLNLDPRHPEAGFRYAREADDPAVLRAEFTPTTPFCPQSDTLATGSFRALNGAGERHEYDLVRVRVDEMHHRHAEINADLERREQDLDTHGAVPGPSGRGGADAAGTGPGGAECGADGGGTTSRGYGPDAPF